MIHFWVSSPTQIHKFWDTDLKSNGRWLVQNVFLYFVGYILISSVEKNVRLSMIYDEVFGLCRLSVRVSVTEITPPPPLDLCRAACAARHKTDLLTRVTETGGQPPADCSYTLHLSKALLCTGGTTVQGPAVYGCYYCPRSCCVRVLLLSKALLCTGVTTVQRPSERVLHVVGRCGSCPVLCDAENIGDKTGSGQVM